MPVHIDITETPSKPAETYRRTTWRAMIQPPGDGGLNMAVDEAILEAVATGASPPTLRFYGWQPPCLSLGRAQRARDVDLARLTERGWQLVRRITGGRAILHTDELTYSVVVPESDPRVAGGIVESYRRLSGGLLAGLHRLGASAARAAGPVGDEGNARRPKGPVCFEAPSDYEVTALGKKLLGSAQTRRKGIVLQHGTLPLMGDLTRICDALVYESEAARDEAKRNVLARATTLQDVTGKTVAFAEAAQAMKVGLAEALNLELVKGELSKVEKARAEHLRAEKYASDAWTLRR